MNCTNIRVALCNAVWRMQFSQSGHGARTQVGLITVISCPMQRGASNVCRGGLTVCLLRAGASGEMLRGAVVTQKDVVIQDR